MNGLNQACNRYFVPHPLFSVYDLNSHKKHDRANAIHFQQPPPQFGVKRYSVADSATGVSLHKVVYCGTKCSQPSLDSGHS